MALQERKNDYNMRAESASDLNITGKKKLDKPMVEKRRRARINNSLSQLKMLVVDVNKKTSPKHKLEKADVLEMAVTYIRNIQKQKVTVAAANDHDVIDKYKSGFYTCAQEVTSFLAKESDFIEETTKLKLLDHLAGCMERPTPKDGPVKVPKRDEKVRVVSQRQPMCASSHPQNTPRHIQSLARHEATRVQGRPLGQASPLPAVDKSSFPLPTVCTPRFHCPTNTDENVPCLLSNQEGSWTRISYPGGASTFDRNNTSPIAEFTNQSSSGVGHMVCSNQGHPAFNMSPLQAHDAFYQNNDFGLGLNVTHPEGGEVWRPW